jgi:hypothetical protein
MSSKKSDRPKSAEEEIKVWSDQLVQPFSSRGLPPVPFPEVGSSPQLGLMGHRQSD